MVLLSSSQVTGPRHPFRKDPDLDYDVDSDEEWEEVSVNLIVTSNLWKDYSDEPFIAQEEPGESLSDCDKDDEEEKLEEDYSKAEDGDDSEDGFFVPDGYLSDNEVLNVVNLHLILQILNEVWGHVDLRIHTGKAFIKNISDLSYGMFDMSTYGWRLQFHWMSVLWPWSLGQLHKGLVVLYKLSFACFLSTKPVFW